MIDLNELIVRIRSDHSRMNQPLSVNIFDPNLNNQSSTTGLNGDFLHFHLLIDVLLRMPFSSMDRSALIERCKQEYQNDPYELMIIDEFNGNYMPEQAIWWYTRECFLYRMLNRALRTANINLLFEFRFILHDLATQLRSDPCQSPIRVYRSQLMSTDEVNRLKHSVGQLISFNSFLSTSRNCDQALAFLHQSEQLQGILFEITADPRLKNIQPFSDITRYSSLPEEEEILFMVGSIFRLQSIDTDEQHRRIVRLKLCDANAHDVQTMFEYVKRDYGYETANLLTLGKLLWKMGKFAQAEKYVLRLLKELPDNHPHISYCYRALGTFADDQGDSQSSLEWHLKAVESMNKIPDHSDDTLMAESCNSIGCIYDAQGHYDRALEFYEKAMHIWKRIYGNDHLNLAASFNNLACVYAELHQYSQAVDFNHRALKIRERSLPANHADLGASHNNLGELYRRLGQYSLCMEHLKQALKIYRLSLPLQHPDTAEVHMNLGLAYENQSQNERAQRHYDQAAEIYHQIFPSKHPCVRKIDRLIERLRSSQISD